jgi:hypothetical protein
MLAWRFAGSAADNPAANAKTSFGHSESDVPLIEEMQLLASSAIKHTIIVDDIDMILNRIGWGRCIKYQQLFDALARLPGYRLKILDSKLRRRSQWLLTPIE